MNTSQTLLHQFRLRRGLVFGVIIVTALFAFEVFNYSTTDFALSDLLGDLKFMGIRWATILAIAFCGIDFAGIARLFTPSVGPGRNTAPAQNETWYLFGAWLLAATMNAMLTWWGVSLAVLGHQTLGNAVISRENLLRIVPIFVSVLVWLIRVLIIGTFSVAGDRLFSQDDQRTSAPVRAPVKVSTSQTASTALTPRPSAPRAAVASSPTFRSAGRSNVTGQEGGYANRPEPTYHSVSASPAANAGNAANNTSNNGQNGSSGASRPTFNRSGSQYHR
jgi:hypothetical protein